MQPKKAGRKPKEEPGINNIGDLLSAVLHYILQFITWLFEVKDPHREDRIIHSADKLTLRNEEFQRLEFCSTLFITFITF